MKPEKLLVTKRNGIIERINYGFILVLDKKKIFAQIGDDLKSSFFFRSSSKPFQALPVINSGAYSHFNFSQKHLAVFSASHSATEEHIAVLNDVLDKTGLNKSLLKCGAHYPLDNKSKYKLIKSDLEPDILHNNCSGKHIGMLSVCLKKNWDLNRYLSLEHPLQKEITEIISHYCEIDRKKIRLSFDGCSAPTHAVPLYNMAIGFLNLVLDDNFSLIRSAVINNPFLFGGDERQDTLIIKGSKGKLFAKVGAEGLCLVVNIDKKQVLLVKIIDGTMKARSIVLYEAIKQLGWLSGDELENIYFKKLGESLCKTLSSDIVGSAEPVFSLV